ncbi:hypothetical protein DSECCO2_271790 [anaerobic digester metagenome]
MTPSLPLIAVFGVYVAVNLAVMALYGGDKRRARLRERRTPERTLLYSALAGPFGALVGMSLFRHKTRKMLFVVAVPLCAAIHCMLAVLLLPHL